MTHNRPTSSSGGGGGNIVNTKTINDAMRRSIIELMAGNKLPLIDKDLPHKIPDSLNDNYDKLYDEFDKYSKINDERLVLGVSSLENLKVRLQELILLYAHSLNKTNGNSEKMSVEQGQFMLKLNVLVNIYCSYSNLNLSQTKINQIENALSKISVTAEFSEPNLNEIIKMESSNKSSEQSQGQEFLKAAERNYTTTFEDIYGIPKVKNLLIKFVDNIIFNDKYNFMILYGPPGTGKSTLAQAMSSAHSNGKAFVLNTTELISPILGHTEQGIKALFEYAEKNKSKNITIILDEMEQIFGKNVTRSVLTTVSTAIQTEIDGARNLGPNVMIIGITNYFSILKDPIRRRATSTCLVEMPNAKELMDFFKKIIFHKIKQEDLDTIELKQSFAQAIWEKINEITAKGVGVSVSNLKNWITSAKQLYFERIMEENNLYSLDNYAIVVIGDTIQFKHTDQDMQKFQTLTLENFIKARMSLGIPIILCPDIKSFLDTEKNITFMPNSTIKLYSKKDEDEENENSMDVDSTSNSISLTQ